MAQLVHFKSILLAYRLVDRLFFSQYSLSAFLVWTRLTLTSDWIEKVKYSDYIKEDALHYPIKSHISVPFVGKSSSMLRVAMSNIDDDIPMILCHMMRVCFNPKDGKSVQLPDDFKNRMSSALVRRRETNNKPEIPSLPDDCTVFYTETMLATSKHMDPNNFVNAKVYMFFAIHSLQEAMSIKGGQSCGIEDSAFIIRDCFMMFERQSFAGDSLTCRLMKTEEELGVIHAVIYKADQRISYIRLDTRNTDVSSPSHL